MPRSSLEFLDRFMDQLTQNRFLCGHVGGPNTDGDLSRLPRVHQFDASVFQFLHPGIGVCDTNANGQEPLLRKQRGDIEEATVWAQADPVLLVLQFNLWFRDFVRNSSDPITQSHDLGANPCLPCAPIHVSIFRFDRIILAKYLNRTGFLGGLIP